MKGYYICIFLSARTIKATVFGNNCIFFLRQKKKKKLWEK